jgi:hypothetical protein
MRGLASKTKELIRYARQLLEADHPQTLRQLHYAIFSRREITYENCQADYRRLGRAMSYARRLYRAWELEYVDGAALAIAQSYTIPRAENRVRRAPSPGFVISVLQCIRQSSNVRLGVLPAWF